MASFAAAAVGILVARDPPDNGQRALFLLCYAFLLTVTTSGLTFVVALAQRLDGNEAVSYTLILAPLITGYSLLLVFYLIFTIFLPPLLLRDLNAAALAEQEEEEQEDTGLGGVIEAVSQQLAPPVLVQQSSTLFRRMGNTQMFERFLPIAGGGVGGTLSALPASGGAAVGAAGTSGTAGAAAGGAGGAGGDVAVTDLESGDALEAGAVRSTTSSKRTSSCGAYPAAAAPRRSRAQAEARACKARTAPAPRTPRSSPQMSRASCAG